MSYVTVPVEIADGHIVPIGPDTLPENGHGLLTILSGQKQSVSERKPRRVDLPLIRGDGKRIINPTPHELDASLLNDLPA